MRRPGWPSLELQCLSFGGIVLHRYNFLDDTDVASDCDGHGTHVASTAAGRMVGVAKAAKVVGVKVLDCQVESPAKNLVSHKAQTPPGNLLLCSAPLVQTLSVWQALSRIVF